MSLSIPPYSVTSYKMHGKVWQNPLFSLFQTPHQSDFQNLNCVHYRRLLPIFWDRSEPEILIRSGCTGLYDGLTDRDPGSAHAIKKKLKKRVRFFLWQNDPVTWKRGFWLVSLALDDNGVEIFKRNKLRDQHRFFSSFVIWKKTRSMNDFFQVFFVFGFFDHFLDFFVWIYRNFRLSKRV